MIYPAIVECSASDDKGNIALVANVGIIKEEGDTDWLKDWKCTYRLEVEYPNGNVFEILVKDVPSGIGPVFIEQHVLFKPFLLFVKPDMPFHCDGCAEMAVQWLIARQGAWAKEYHNDWYQAYCLGSGRLAQRQH